MKPIEYRLRKDDQIVGYSKTIGKSTFYSPDKLWWGGKKIDFKQRDLGVGYQDINAEWLFENDLIRLKNEKEIIQLIYDEMIDQFLGVDYLTQEILYPNIEEKLKNRASRRISFSFIQKEK